MKSATPKTPFTSYQRFVVGLLAFLQFTIILDFMIISPLGAFLMPALQITPAQFGLVVSAYAFSAGLSGLLAAGFADRFDRKKLLLFFYVGFVGGTLLCGIAPTYHFLLVARMVTGIFGGVIGSIVFAITTDLFPMQMRGRVMGIVQAAFAASQVFGLPLGLYLSTHWGWHAPFLLIVGVSSAVGLVILARLKPIKDHLKIQSERSPLKHLLATVSQPRYIQGFATTALLSTGGFMLMPFGSAFTVNNMGRQASDLPLIYMVTGVCTFAAGPWVGRLADTVGKLQMFLVGSALSIFMVFVYTTREVTPLPVVILINAILFISITARIISSSALMSALPAPEDRGAFMAVSASIQQISGGIASALAGLIVVQSASGHLDHFEELGFVVAGATFITMGMMYYLNRYIQSRARTQ